MANIVFPPVAFNPTAFGVLANASIYIGTVNLDPTVLANRIDVTVIQQDGTPVVFHPASQPFVLNAGGMFSYNGSVVNFTSTTPYSMTIAPTTGNSIYLPNSSYGDTTSVSNILLNAVGSDPAAAADTGNVYAKNVAGITELFYEDSEGTVLQITTNGAINVDLGSDTVTAAIFTAVLQVTGTQFRGEPILLTIDGSGNVECDLTLGLNYSLTLDQNVNTFSFTNAPEGRVPNICVEIINTGAFGISTFQVNTVGATVWIPSGVASLNPTHSATTSYGMALFPNARFHVFPVLMQQII